MLSLVREVGDHLLRGQTTCWGGGPGWGGGRPLAVDSKWYNPRGQEVDCGQESIGRKHTVGRTCGQEAHSLNHSVSSAVGKRYTRHEACRGCFAPFREGETGICPVRPSVAHRMPSVCVGVGVCARVREGERGASAQSGSLHAEGGQTMP